ncbi:2-dehydropantoate 2-reductase [Halomonas sp. E19]|uniref:2-dehydropantoate 2-reductase n=1 Tax=Halomonas sp. E19 TaxID=3397247 RepID=UPI00403438FE
MSDTHLIVGPGALGRLLALSLAKTVPVQLAGRRPLPADQTLVTPEGAAYTHRLACHLSDQLPALAPAWVHLTTKAYSAEAAYAQIMARVPASTPLVLWQNGYEIQPRLDERHPGPVLCASTTEGPGYRATPGSCTPVADSPTSVAWVAAMQSSPSGWRRCSKAQGSGPRRSRTSIPGCGTSWR